MFKSETNSRNNHASGFLTIPRYSDMIRVFSDCDDAIKIMSLYRKLFDHNMPNLHALCKSFDLIEELAKEVNQSLFPVDLQSLYQYTCDYGRGSLELIPILVQGEGIPIRVSGLQGLARAVEPLVYALLPVLQEYNEFELPNSSDCNQLNATYWSSYGHHEPPSFSWIYDNDEMIKDLLSHLPEPFNGLATLFDCIWRESDNPFLSWCSETIYEDFARQPDYWTWNQECISDLTRLYKEEQAEIKKLHAYYRWCGSNDIDGVIEALLELERMYCWYA